VPNTEGPDKSGAEVLPDLQYIKIAYVEEVVDSIK
jgi:hypothetical protein